MECGIYHREDWKGETIIDGAIREVKEETGIDIKGENITGVYKFGWQNRDA